MFWEECIIVIPSVLISYFSTTVIIVIIWLRTPNTLDVINSRVNLYTFISQAYCYNVRSHSTFLYYKLSFIS